MILVVLKNALLKSKAGVRMIFQNDLSVFGLKLNSVLTCLSTRCLFAYML